MIIKILLVIMTTNILIIIVRNLKDQYFLCTDLEQVILEGSAYSTKYKHIELDGGRDPGPRDPVILDGSRDPGWGP